MSRYFILVLFYSQLGFGWTLIGSGIQGWDTNELTVNLNTSNCTVSDATIEAAVDAAIETWNQAPTANLILKRGVSTTSVANFMADTATDTPVILCDPNFSATTSANGNSIPAATMRMSANPHLSYGGVLLNAEVGMGAEISNLSNARLALMLAHELGHVLGLGHTQASESLMYYSLAGKDELYLTQDDRVGLTFLYPMNEFTGSPFGCGAVHLAVNSGPRKIWFFGFLFFLLAINRLLGKWVLRYEPKN